ncbi:type-2 ice-structuring protein-like [Procambarus clarkii]|uniref:type-2 ice-structuring protein-like n=1 Tax=Procambarus clarkii TaxID=6728 RepID=UPI00374375F0
MRMTCQELGGDLLKLNSGDLFADIVRHIHGNDMIVRLQQKTSDSAWFYSHWTTLTGGCGCNLQSGKLVRCRHSLSSIKDRAVGRRQEDSLRFRDAVSHHTTQPVTMDHCWLLLFLLGTSTTTDTQQEEVPGRTGVSATVCPDPFKDVGGRCLYFENVNKASWQGMRTICQGHGGDLIKLNTPDLFGDIISYIHGNGWSDTNYWIGGTDEGHEGVWTWTDGSSVRMGTPFWANTGCDNVQQPVGGDVQNCIVLDAAIHMYFNDLPCNSTYHGICEG